MPVLRASAMLAVLLLAGAPAAAQETEDEALNCDRVLAYEDLVGSYTITLGNSILKAPGSPAIPMPTRDVLQGTLAAIGDSLVLSAPNNDVTFQFTGSDEPDWRWSTDEEMAHVSSEDLGLVLGCDVNALPRLVGKGTGRSSDGHTLDLTYRLVVPHEGLLYGQFQWQAQGMTMTRSAMFEENQ